MFILSEYVHFKGEIEPVQPNKNETMETLCRRVLASQHGLHTLPNYYDNFEEYLLDHFYQDYIIYDNTLYKLNLTSVGFYDDIYEAQKLDNGKVKIDVKYYNGGTNLSEAISKAMENSKQER